MEMEYFALPAVLLVILTSISLLVQPDWRISIASFVLQSVGVFVLVAIRWPVGMAATKLLAGWMAGAVLGMALISLPGLPAAPRQTGILAEDGDGKQPIASPAQAASDIPSLAGRIFRVLAALLVGLSVASVAPIMADWMPGITLESAWGGLILIGTGMLQLGFTARPFRTILALLTALSGFEILYASVEVSVLVAGLLAAVNLSLALAGAYLMLTNYMEAE